MSLEPKRSLRAQFLFFSFLSGGRDSNSGRERVISWKKFDLIN